MIGFKITTVKVSMFREVWNPPHPTLPIPSSPPHPACVPFPPTVNSPTNTDVCFSLPQFPHERWGNISGAVFYINLLCACMHVYIHAQACHGIHTGVRGQLLGIASLPPPCGSQGSSAGHQACCSKGLYARSHLTRPHVRILNVYVCEYTYYMRVLKTDSFIPYFPCCVDQVPEK